MFEQEQNDINGFKVIDTSEKAEVSIDNKKPKNFSREILNYLILIVIAFGLAQIIHHFIFTPVTVEGDSMKTIIHDKDRIFLLRFGKIDRGDVIVFDVSISDDPFIKRVIGLPGEDVKMVDYKIYIDGELLEEPYLDDNPIYTGIEYSSKTNFDLEAICSITGVDCQIGGKVKIPKGYYLVLGDNRNDSTDSRDIGLVPEDKILGRAIFVIYPFNRFGKTFGE
jgi:signal peptidase I